MKSKIILAALMSLFFTQGVGVAEETEAVGEEILFFEMEARQLTIATKHLQSVREAPAIVAVVTGQEIRNMGARDLLDILRRVPGFGVSINHQGRTEFEIRGIKSQDSERMLLLIDGVSVNELVHGGLATAMMQISVDHIKRIEIIRGPGSALHGSNAFSGVVNVVTKRGADMMGVTVSGGRGSFDTDTFSIEAGKRFADLDAAFFLNYRRTDGPRREVPVDFLGNSGMTDFRIERLDTGFKIGYKDLALNTRLIRLDQGPYLGALFAVNDESDLDMWYYFSDLSYRHGLGQNARVTIRTYVEHAMEDFYWELFPEGSGPFTDGMIGSPSGKELERGVEAQFDYRLMDSHRLTIGAVTERKRLYDTRHIANFDPLTGAPLGATLDITDDGNYIQDRSREIWAVYLQDDWSVTEEVNLVAGVRHDRYSDFGATTNPRVAAVWRSGTWDAKLMYGTAFMAPTFGSLYFINNPTLLGNPDLDPEEMQTYEASIGYVADGTEGRISYFHNDFDQKIQLQLQPSGAFQFVNRGGAIVQGVEIEAKQAFGLFGALYGNYTYQKTEDAETHLALADVAAHKGNVGFDLYFLRHFNANVNLFMIGKKPRAPGDPRRDAPGYALLDATVIAKELLKGLELRMSVHNLLDKAYADPLPAVVPGDLPRERRAVMVEATYLF